MKEAFGEVDYWNVTYLISNKKKTESNSSETLEENALLFIYIMAHPYTKLLYNYHKILSWVYYVLAWKMLSYTDV